MESLPTVDKRVFRNFSFSLMFQLIPIFIISSYLVYEINPYLFKKQMIYYVLQP